MQGGVQPSSSLGYGPLLARRWQPSVVDGARVLVIQFNALAQSLAHDTFVGVPAEALEWTRRSFLIGQEIGRAIAAVPPDTPAVVCMQEVDAECVDDVRRASSLWKSSSVAGSRTVCTTLTRSGSRRQRR